MFGFAGVLIRLQRSLSIEEIAGIKSNKKIDGISILPTLTGNDKQQKQHEYLYWEFHENNGRQAVRYGKWKGVKYNVSINTNAPIELYDLEKDPSEKNNIASSHKDIIEKLELFIQQAHQSNKDWPLLKQELGDRKIE